jgi:hypothetical protein
MAMLLMLMQVCLITDLGSLSGSANTGSDYYNRGNEPTIFMDVIDKWLIFTGFG